MGAVTYYLKKPFNILAIMLLLIAAFMFIWVSGSTLADEQPLLTDCIDQQCTDQVQEQNTVCPNLDGFYGQVPEGYYLNEKGMCVDQNPSETIAGTDEPRVLGVTSEVLGK